MVSRKRGNNEGSIFQRKDGRWTAQAQVGYKEDGSRKFVTYYGKTRQEVAEKLKNTLSDISKNVFADAGKMSLEEWVWNWLKIYKKNIVRPNTYSRYIYVINDYIVPALGKVKLKNVTSSHIQSLYNSCVEKGLSPSSIKHIHNVLSPALDQAVKEGLITINPAHNTTRPAIKKAKVTVISTDNQVKLLKYLKDDTMGILIKMALLTGCRMGELLGLKWNDIDFNNLEIHLNQGVSWKYEFDDEKHTSYRSGVTLADLKTESSIRAIPIRKETAQMLMRYKLNQRSFCPKVEDKESFFPDMVFLSEAGTLLNESNVRKRYAKILRNLDIPYAKFHALRHTFATNLLENGIHPKIAQTLLGHSEMRTSMEIYSHVLPNMTREAIEKTQGIV